MLYAVSVLIDGIDSPRILSGNIGRVEADSKDGAAKNLGLCIGGVMSYSGTFETKWYTVPGTMISVFFDELPEIVSCGQILEAVKQIRAHGNA